MKTILFIAPGNSIHSVRWIQNYGRDFNLVWLSLHPFIEEAKDLKEVEKIYFPLNIFNALLLQIIAFKIFIKYKPNLVHIHSINRYLLPALPLAFKKIPLLLTPWGSDVHYGRNNFFLKKLMLYFLKKAKLIITDSKKISDICIKEFNIPEKNFEEIYHGSNPEIFTFVGFDAQKAALEGITFTSVRLLEDIYNIDTIIKAFSIFQENNKNSIHKLIICASGSKEQELKELARKYLIEGSYKFTGRLSQGDMKAVISESDVIISASKSDAGLSASIGEGMMMGKTILASDSGGENELWIENGQNGYLFDCNSHHDLSSKLSFCCNLDFLTKSAKINHSIAMERYNSSVEREKVLEIYKIYTS